MSATLHRMYANEQSQPSLRACCVMMNRTGQLRSNRSTPSIPRISPVATATWSAGTLKSSSRAFFTTSTVTVSCSSRCGWACSSTMGRMCSPVCFSSSLATASRSRCVFSASPTASFHSLRTRSLTGSLIMS